ncbi:MAG: hypothetical protein IRZ16_02830 [Myxococcaceae bacterium]|nr:hypothetical protein [Myxococcaceae bacterium]
MRQVDNTPPIVQTQWTGNGRSVLFQANVSDGFGSGIAEVKMGALTLTPLVVVPPPYQLWVTIPAPATSVDILFNSFATDQFGNQGGDTLLIHVECKIQGTQEVCTHTQLPL